MMINAVDAIKERVKRGAEAIVRELATSHGFEGVSVSISETAKSITVTIREAKGKSEPVDESDE